MNEATRLALADLTRSGLDRKCLQEGSGIRVLTRGEAVEFAPDLMWWKFAPEGLCCILFEYADLDGRPNGIWRMRRLEDPPAGGWGSLIELPKYLGPRRARPGLWLPRGIPWREVAADTSKEIVAVEGEKKAEALWRRAEIIAVGLAGVWSASSKRQRIDVLPELLSIRWSGRRTVVLFDAEEKPRTSAHVAQAAARYGDLVRSQGADVFKATLPLLERKAS